MRADTIQAHSPAKFFCAATLMVWLLAGFPAWAEPACGRRQAVVEALGARFGEVPVARGLDATGQMVEILASPDGSWTMIVTQPSGASCLAASGEGWQSVEPKADPGRDS